MAEERSEEQVVMETLELLENRLSRLNYLVNGSSWLDSGPKSQNIPIFMRLHELRVSLDTLSLQSKAVHDILELETKFPDLFHPIASADSPQTLTLLEIVSTVLSYASAFPETASRLNLIKDLPIPSAEASTKLIRLLPRLEKLAATQTAQSQELENLRIRSAALVERWYKLGVLEGGECWAEWESRLEHVERRIRRQEHLREQEDST